MVGMKPIKKVHGPYERRQDKRNVVVILYLDGTRTTKSYARYLMEKHLQRELDHTEDVDHINNDKTDDRIENLKVVYRSDNIRKSVIADEKQAKIFYFICPICLKPASKSYASVKGNWDKNKSGPFCSKECGGIFTNGGWGTVTEDYNKFKQNLINTGHMSKSENETVLKTVGYIGLAGSSPAMPTKL